MGNLCAIKDVCSRDPKNKNDNDNDVSIPPNMYAKTHTINGASSTWVEQTHDLCCPRKLMDIFPDPSHARSDHCAESPWFIQSS